MIRTLAEETALRDRQCICIKGAVVQVSELMKETVAKRVRVRELELMGGNAEGRRRSGDGSENQAHEGNDGEQGVRHGLSEIGRGSEDESCCVFGEWFWEGVFSLGFLFK